MNIDPSDPLAQALSANPMFSEALFDALPDVVFFVKDAQSRYVAVNQTLAQRCGHQLKEKLIGRTTVEVFGASYGDTWLAQDEAVLTSGIDIFDRLELHLYPDRD